MPQFSRHVPVHQTFLREHWRNIWQLCWNTSSKTTTPHWKSMWQAWHVSGYCLSCYQLFLPLLLITVCTWQVRYRWALERKEETSAGYLWFAQRWRGAQACTSVGEKSWAGCQEEVFRSAPHNWRAGMLVALYVCVCMRVSVCACQSSLSVNIVFDFCSCTQHREGHFGGWGKWQ